jgi:hypothetical protein
MRSKAIAGSVLAVFIALALNVVPFAGAEEEAAPEFKAEKSPSNIDAFGPVGGHEYYLRFTNQNGVNTDVKCSNRTGSNFNGVTFPTTTLKTSVGFGTCTLNGETAAASTNGCEYEYKLVTGSEPATATLDILCPSKPIEFASTKCTITIPEQKGLKHVLFSNTAGATPPDLTATFSITTLEYTVSFSCPEQTKKETKNNGIYTDGLTVQATNGGKLVGISVE